MPHNMHVLFAAGVFLSLLAIGSLANTELTTIKAGLKFGETLTTPMKADTFVRFLGRAATKAMPFISAAVSFVEFILSSEGNNESRELLAIKRLYNEMDRRFDIIDLEFEGIKKLIDWSRVKTQYSSIEQNILTEAALFRHIYTAPLVIKESGKDYFLHSFESNCLTCAENLYLGLIGKGLTLSSEIFGTAMQSFSYDRPKTQTFMVGMLKLFIQGITNELAYRKLKYGEADYKYHHSVWAARLQNVTTEMIKVDRLIRNNYRAQYVKDIKQLSLANPTSILSHEKMATKIYDFVVQKYDWRDWLVMVYDPIATVKSTVNHVCDGFTQYGTYGRNIVIDSVEKSKPTIDKDEARGKISDITTYVTHTDSNFISFFKKDKTSTERYTAQQIYNSLSSATKDCSVYGSVGVNPPNANLWYKALQQRLVHVNNGAKNTYSIHLFG